MTKNEKIIQEIIKHAHQQGNMTFLAVEKIFSWHGFDFDGNQYPPMTQSENLLVWDGWNTEALDLFKEALDRGQLEAKYCGIVPYLVDGGGLACPLATEVKDYDEPHWAPVFFNKKGASR